MIFFTMIFNGSLQDFIDFADKIRREETNAEGQSIMRWDPTRDPGSPFTRTLLIGPNADAEAVGKIQAVTDFDPNAGMMEPIHLMVTIEDRHYEDVWWLWTAFRELMEKEGLLIGDALGPIALPKSAQGGRPDEGPRSRGGRPRDPDYEWARREVHNLRRNPALVYQEWLQRLDPARRSSLANLLSSFKKAIKKKPE